MSLMMSFNGGGGGGGGGGVSGSGGGGGGLGGGGGGGGGGNAPTTAILYPDRECCDLDPNTNTTTTTLTQDPLHPLNTLHFPDYHPSGAAAAAPNTNTNTNTNTSGGGDGSSSSSSSRGGGGRRRRRRTPPQAIFDINDNSLYSVYCFFKSLLSASTASTVAIDNKIEQAMDLVKSHLMFAVREEVEVLKEKITELLDRISQLEYENMVLRQYATQEALQKIQQHHASNT